MLYLKEGFPEVNEIVKCTVKRIYGNTVFVHLDEYDKEGVLTISEIAPGRIRNIRDYVVENKVIVCKVIRVIPSKNHIDVSLRRVPLMVKKEKLEEIKREEFAEKIYEEIAKRLNTDKEKLFERTYEPIFEEYSTVFDALQDVVKNEEKIEMFTNLSKKEKEVFLEVLKAKIKPKEVTFKENIKVISYEEDGIKKIKKIFEDAIKEANYEKIEVVYLAAGKYSITVTHNTEKEADKIINKVVNFITNNSKKYKVSVL